MATHRVPAVALSSMKQAAGVRFASAASRALSRQLFVTSRAATPAFAARSSFTPRSRVAATARHFATIQVKTPELGGESITEGTIMEWKFKPGDLVKKGDLLAVIETDKVTVDVKAEAAGVLQEILVAADGTCEPGMPLCNMNSDMTAAPTAAAPAATPASASSSAAPAAAASGSGEKVVIKTPDFGAESITEGTIMEWKYKVGDFVKRGEILALVETDKVTVEVKAEVDGYLREIKVAADGTAEVDAELCVMEKGDAPTGAAAVAAAPAAAAAAAPVAAAAAAAAAAPAVAPTEAAASAETGRTVRREKMKRMRIAIARNLKETQNTMAMLTTFQEVDMSSLIQLRKEYKDLFESTNGAKLGFMSPFFKASAFALEQVPSLNSYIDTKTNEIVYRDYVDISFAAATPRGLVTPVIRDVQKMNIKNIEADFQKLSGLAKSDKLDMSQITGSTFTISNGGVFGSMLGTPLIGSTEQAAVLGLHATKNRAVVLKNGEIGVRPVMYVALTYDHRIVDGREAVTFLSIIKDQVEDPRRLLLQC